jgi:hypothetical protein
MSDIKVHDETFTPRRRGRRPITKIDDLLQTVAENPGSWCSKDYPEKEAASVIRQLKTQYQNLDVASMRDGDTRRVFVMLLED